MSTPPVYWHQGMFLRPHHFQAAERYWADQLRRSAKFDVHHDWGLRTVAIDLGALRNYRFEVDRLEARLRDGTLVRAEKGTDTELAPLDLKAVMEGLGPGQTVDVLLAVPQLQVGRPNAGGPGDPGVRFHVDAAREPVPDENTGQYPSLVETRRLNARLLTADQNTSGFETVPVARVERSSQVAAPPQIHPWYIPPVLACDGWPPLYEEVIGEVYNRVGGLVKQLAKQVRDQNIRFDSNAPEQRKIFERLRTLNEGYAAFGVIARAAGAHPFDGYLELCRLAGKLAVFGKNATLPDDLPAYDHDDLGRCFFTVKRYIDDLLTQDFSQGYEMRPFVGDGLRMRVQIEPAWLAPACHVLVGVESALNADDCAKLLTGRLNMKIGALERVDEIFRVGQKGLDFVHDHKPPPVLPGTAGSGANLTYFRLNQTASREEWNAVAQTYNLAIRLNQTLLVGSMDGRSDVTIQAGGKTANMRFTLYVVLPSAQAS
jgi:type VI secretion system protein ImpJ